jgi:uncharacterized membrane protein YkoI
LEISIVVLITGALTAAAIAELAFKAAINTGAGELTKGAIAKGKQLWQKICGKVKEEGASETALLEVEGDVLDWLLDYNKQGVMSRVRSEVL